MRRRGGRTPCPRGMLPSRLATSGVNAARSSPRRWLLDLHLPDRDGLAIAREISPRYPAVGIVLVTGILTEPPVETMAACGIHRFLCKLNATSSRALAGVIRSVATSQRARTSGHPVR